MRMLLQLGLTYGLLQATRVWRLQGWEESSAKLSTCCLLWTSEQKEEQRRTITAAHTHTHSQVSDTRAAGGPHRNIIHINKGLKTEFVVCSGPYCHPVEHI
ncbi:hypothetical protein ILYODFUR_017899 [Ilyodon furcidens]|uniref:Secreted protein n=1 Tax=Ilyodon furcidens TaxID=33524 RepID=A0ABV0VEX7_9TELE